METKKLTQRFSAKIGDGEKREIVFLANSGKQMADGATVDLDTLTVRDPDTDELVAVKDLSEGDAKNYVALLSDHSWAIDSKIGQVRGLWLADGGLYARATLAHTEAGDHALALAKDDMLDTFSITVTVPEKVGEDGVIHNAQILEISAVWLGNDERTKLISVNNNQKGQAMTEIRENKLSADEADELKNKLDDLLKSYTDDSTEPTEDKPTPAADDQPAQNSFATVAKNAREAKVETKANTIVHQVEVKSNAKSWKDSKEALRAFRNAIVHNNGRMGGGNAYAEYARVAKQNGLSGSDILPTSIERIFFKGWTDQDSILSTFRQSGARRLTVTAWQASGEDGRAKGNKKGEAKAEQTLSHSDREVMTLPIYKKLALYVHEIFDDESGELVKFRAEELADRLYDEIARGAILGDGRTAPTDSKPDYRVFRDNRGLNSMAADINNQGDFGAIVSTKIAAADAPATLYAKVRKALGKVHATGNNGKVVVLPEGGSDEILATTDANGRPIYPLGSSVELAFPNVKFFEAEWMNSADFDVIAYANQGYALIGEANPKVYTDFDINMNQDVMLVEQFVGGSLFGRKVAAGVLNK